MRRPAAASPGSRQLAKWIPERRTHSHMAWVAAAARSVVADLLLIVRAAGNQYSLQTNPRPHRASRKRGREPGAAGPRVPAPRLHKSRGPHRSLARAASFVFFAPLGNKIASDAAAVAVRYRRRVKPICAHGPYGRLSTAQMYHFESSISSRRLPTGDSQRARTTEIISRGDNRSETQAATALVSRAAGVCVSTQLHVYRIKTLR